MTGRETTEGPTRDLVSRSRGIKTNKVRDQETEIQRSG